MNQRINQKPEMGKKCVNNFKHRLRRYKRQVPDPKVPVDTVTRAEKGRQLPLIVEPAKRGQKTCAGSRKKKRFILTLGEMGNVEREKKGASTAK